MTRYRVDMETQILRKPHDSELRAWDNDWVMSMDKFVGKFAIVKALTPTSIKLELIDGPDFESIYSFPYCCLEPEPAPEPLWDKLLVDIQKYKFIARDEDGALHLYFKKPQQDKVMWTTTSGYKTVTDVLMMADDRGWRDSLHSVEEDGSLTHVPYYYHIVLGSIEHKIDYETYIKIKGML